MAFDGGAVTLTVTEAAGVLGISRGLAYSCANRFIESEGAEGLPVVRLGRRLVVPMHQLQRLLSGERSLVAHGAAVSEVPPPDTRPEVANNDGVVTARSTPPRPTRRPTPQTLTTPVQLSLPLDPAKQA